MSAGRVGEGIGPRGQQDLDEAFGFAVGAGRLGPGAQVPPAARGTMAAPRGGAIGRAAVRHHRRHGAPAG